MRKVVALIAIAVGLSLSTGAFADKLPTAKPEAVGMDSAKLKKVDQKINQLIKDKKLAGATVMVAKDGKIVHFGAFGYMDLAKKKPMRKDTIFRIYSMSKSIATAAALILVDEKKLDLDAPVSQYLPAFKGLKVYQKAGPAPAKREMTVRDLMRHTAGLTYGYFGNSEVDKLYRNAGVLGGKNLAELEKKLGKIPLIYQPGTDWTYSVAIDVLGRVVEVVSGKSFDEFLHKRIFEPLDMKDTGFQVPKDKIDRFATCYNSDGKGKLTVQDDPKTSRYVKKVTFFSGGGGLVSTTRDYMRFLMMVQNGGELDGKRILSKKSVELMRTNQLPKEVKWIKFGDEVREGVGFGLGFSVRVKMSKWDPQGRIGEYGWGGAASTHYWVSPKDNLIVVTMEQTMPYSFLTEFAVKGAIYDAIKK